MWSKVGRALKKTGKVAALPVTIPVNAAKRGAQFVMNKTLEGILRHLLTTAGGAAAASGYLLDSDVAAAVGAVMTLVGMIMSARAKRKAEASAELKAQLAVVAKGAR